MGNNSRLILTKILDEWRKERTPDLSEQDYFEIFCAEQILKDFLLSYEDLQAGIVDGSHDGGVDSVYSFVNGELVCEDFKCPPLKRGVDIELHIIQSKTSGGFKEAAVNCLISTTRQLLKLDVDYDELLQYNALVKTVFDNFRQTYRELASTFPTLKICYYYAAQKANDRIHDNLQRKAKELRNVALDLFPEAEVAVEFLGAGRLLDLARKRPTTTHELRVNEKLSSVNGYVVLSPLSEYARFLKDSDGKLRVDLFEANVRDFQGNTEVNAEIVNTLQTEKTVDFWWMNNGVTILASRATLNGDTVTIENPQIVNGLQTSRQIAHHCPANPEDKRSIMLKIVSSEDEETRDKIIKATNRQNPIQIAALRATDKVQRDIEEAMRSQGLFYDRRKNFYKNEGKPASKIISIPLMAQSVMTIILGRPDSARARPSSLIKKDEDYEKVFSKDYPITLYTNAATLIRVVDRVLKSRSGITAKDRSNIRFYVLFWLTTMLTRKEQPKPCDVANLNVRDIDDRDIEATIDKVWELYENMGKGDQVAKGSALRKATVDEVKKMLSNIPQEEKIDAVG